MLIRNERELKLASARLEALKAESRAIRAELEQRGMQSAMIATATQSQDILADEIEWDIALFRRLQNGELAAIPEFAPEERGKALVCLRLVKGWTQRELAAALGVSEAVLSRDENNEYRGISLERYGKILTALGFEDRARFVPAA